MINLQNIKDFREKTVQDILASLNRDGYKIIAVFDLKEQNLINLYFLNSILVQDEQNRKTFMIKGKLIPNLGDLIQQSNSITNINSQLETLPVVTHTYSENMFGFIAFGLQGY